MEWRYLLTLLAAVVIWGLYGTYVGRRNAEYAFTRQEREAQAQARGKPVSGRWIVSFLAVAFLTLGGMIGARYLWDQWHPALEEHRAELLDTFEGQTRCSQENMTVVPVSASVARVDGCGHSLTFRWVLENRRSTRASWRLIDPDCFRTVFGFIKFSCS